MPKYDISLSFSLIISYTIFTTMNLISLHNFITKGGTWAEGVEIYKELGSSQYLKDYLFARPENPYSFERLKEELRELYQQNRAPIEAPVISEKPKTPGTISGLSVDEFFNLPQELQRRRLEIGQLYSEIMSCRQAVRREINEPAIGTLTLQEAFDIMFQLDSRGRPVPFNILWVTYDTKTGKGGEVRHYDCVLKFSNKTGSKFKPVESAVSDRRDPRHDIHGTINLQVCNTLEVRKANTWLILMLNGYNVMIGNNG